MYIGGGGGGFLRHGGSRRVRELILCRYRDAPFPKPSRYQLARHYCRRRLFSSEIKESLPSPSFSVPSPASTSSPASSSSRNGFVSWYLGMIEARPVLTKSITAGVIFTVADISSQIITFGPSSPLDYMRTMRMAGYGMVFSGPSLHLWFNSMSRIIPKLDVTSTLKKMFLGQAVYGPIMTSVFFSLNAAFQGEMPAEIQARLRRDLIPTLVNGLVYWPMCDFITFRFVQVRLQPLVSNSFSFLWTVYITYMASLQKATVVEEDKGTSSIPPLPASD